MSTLEAIEELVVEGELDEAEERLDEAMETFGEEPRLLVLRAEIALDAEDFEECLVATRHALKNEALNGEEAAPERARLLALEAYANFYLDKVEEARVLFNEAVRADGTSWTAILGRAMVHEHKGYLRATLLDVDRAIELDDQESQPFAIRASVYLRSGALEEAERDFGSAVELDPADEEARLQLARLQALDRRTAAAIETLEPLVEEGEDPEFVIPAALLRSQLSLTLGSYEAAGEDAQKAIDLDPDLPWGYLQLAACHLTAMNAGKALETLKEAAARVNNERDLPDLFALRASAYDQLEKTEKARELREAAEGWARLPSFVYGEILNPAQNVPINPNKPVDVRSLLTDLFGDPALAPEGYERAIREVVDRIPELVAQNPGVGRIQIELPQVEGMEGPPRTLVLQVNNPKPAGVEPAEAKQG
ncbi:MAG: tetratricopeptide repeat protein [Bradymonadaceae bacterium]